MLFDGGDGWIGCTYHDMGRGWYDRFFLFFLFFFFNEWGWGYSLLNQNTGEGWEKERNGGEKKFYQWFVQYM